MQTEEGLKHASAEAGERKQLDLCPTYTSSSAPVPVLCVMRSAGVIRLATLGLKLLLELLDGFSSLCDVHSLAGRDLAQDDVPAHLRTCLLSAALRWRTAAADRTWAHLHGVDVQHAIRGRHKAEVDDVRKGPQRVASQQGGHELVLQRAGQAGHVALHGLHRCIEHCNAHRREGELVDGHLGQHDRHPASTAGHSLCWSMALHSLWLCLSLSLMLLWATPLGAARKEHIVQQVVQEVTLWPMHRQPE